MAIETDFLCTQDYCLGGALISHFGQGVGAFLREGCLFKEILTLSNVSWMV